MRRQARRARRGSRARDDAAIYGWYPCRVWSRLRLSEWALIVFFSYSALVAVLFPMGAEWKAAAVGVAAVVSLLALALSRFDKRAPSDPFSVCRDWLPIALTLVAYREMNWFTAAHPTHTLEHAWIVWDRLLLHQHGLQRLIEYAGWPLPGFLELCYLLVYGVGPFAVGTLYAYKRRDLVDRVLFTYLAGTLLAYGLFPYFPSEPPRTVFVGLDLPNIVTPLRRLNLAIVGGYGIHSSVFPSAHVSSAFSAGWALLVFLPEHRAVGSGMLVYAAAVAIATVYGRYHYAVDALAGFGISLVALALAIQIKQFSKSAETQC